MAEAQIGPDGVERVTGRLDPCTEPNAPERAGSLTAQPIDAIARAVEQARDALRALRHLDR